MSRPTWVPRPRLTVPWPRRSRGSGGSRSPSAVPGSPIAGRLPHPFGVFPAGHYSTASALDLLPPPGYALRLEPHPRFFTDQSGEVPLAVAGHLQRFWPRQFFAMFKAPTAAGLVHVFRPGEPYGQMLVVPTDLQYRAEPMDEFLAADRAKQDRQTYQLGHRLASTSGDPIVAIGLTIATNSSSASTAETGWTRFASTCRRWKCLTRRHYRNRCASGPPET